MATAAKDSRAYTPLAERRVGGSRGQVCAYDLWLSAIARALLSTQWPPPPLAKFNQQEPAVKAATSVASLQAPAQGTPQGQGGLSGSPRAPAGALVAVGWNARLGYNGSGTFGNAAAVDDDYDRDLQAALAASVADQPGSQAACAVKPGENDSPVPGYYTGIIFCQQLCQFAVVYCTLALHFCHKAHLQIHCKGYSRTAAHVMVTCCLHFHL